MRTLLFAHHKDFIDLPKGHDLIHVINSEWWDQWVGGARGSEVRVITDLAGLALVADKEKATRFICCGSRWIFKKEFLNQFPDGAYNIHPAYLPQYGGAANASWQIMDTGSSHQGATLHDMTDRIDFGTVRAFGETPGEALNKFLNNEGTPMPLNYRDYWPALRAHTNGAIDWNWGARDIKNFLNAFEPHGGAFSYCRGERIRLTYKDMGRYKLFHPFAYGLVLFTKGQEITVAVNGGRIVLESDIKLREGDRLWTPQEDLDKARTYRP